jgi:hypothetical protein
VKLQPRFFPLASEVATENFIETKIFSIISRVATEIFVVASGVATEKMFLNVEFCVVIFPRCELQVIAIEIGLHEPISIF